jgi:hypothetical protein
MRTTFLLLTLATSLAAQDGPRFSVVSGHVSNNFLGGGGSTPTTVLVEHETGKTWVLVNSSNHGPGWLPLTTFTGKEPPAPTPALLNPTAPSTPSDLLRVPAFPPKP